MRGPWEVSSPLHGPLKPVDKQSSQRPCHTVHCAEVSHSPRQENPPTVIFLDVSVVCAF